MSVDSFLGLPYNIASYALLTHFLAHITGLEAGELIADLSNAHLYQNHLEAAKEQVQRTPFPLPSLTITRKVDQLEDFQYEDFYLDGYQSHPEIKAPLSVGE